MLVAPLDANTLGKVASGICDNLLVSDSLGLPPSRGRAHCVRAAGFFWTVFSPGDPCVVGGCSQNTVPWTTLHPASPVLQQVARWPGS